MHTPKQNTRKNNAPDFNAKHSHFKEIFFYKPTKNTHNASQFEQKFGSSPMNTFRTKGKPQFGDNCFESSLNPFARGTTHKQEAKNVTGARKKMSEWQSFKKTDPISMRHETVHSQPVIREFEPSASYRKEGELRSILPCERTLSRSRIQYKSQVGYSRSLDHAQRQRPALNDSSLMRAIIHPQ